MPTESVVIKIEDGQNVAGALEKAAAQLDATTGELVVDFSSVRQIDPAGLRALENLVRTAEEKSIKVSLRCVNVAVYKALKLMKLASRLAFVD